MPGLINTSINKKDPLKNVVGYEPERIAINPATDTVAGQVNEIINKDSPLMQSARTRSKQAMNQRGLLNTSMAIGAGEQALYDVALPIASQDASIYNQTKQLNQQAGNRAMEVTGTAQNTAALQERSGQQNIESIRESGQQERQIQAMRGQQNIESIRESGQQERQIQAMRGQQERQIQAMRGQQAIDISNIEAQYRNLIQASDSAERYFTTISNGISDILTNPDIPAPQKQTLVNKQVQFLQSGLAVIGGISNLNLTDLLVFS